MRAVSIKKEYEKEWGRLLKNGTIETDGKTARVLAGVLSTNGLEKKFNCYYNRNLRRTIIKLDKRIPTYSKKRWWDKTIFYL